MRTVTGWGTLFTLRCNSHFHSGPKGQGRHARTGSVPKTPKLTLLWLSDPLSEKFHSSVLKEFTTTLIHVLWFTFYANFKEIGRREVGETMSWFCDKNVLFCHNFAPIWQRAPKVCRGACRVIRHLPVNFVPISYSLPYYLISEKIISYDRNICRRHICGYQTVKKFHDTFSCFERDHSCDKQTNRHTEWP